MPGLLTGSRALVTGAGRGVGPVIAKRLADEGAAVALAFRTSRQGADEAVASIVERGGRAVALQADLLEQAQAERLVGEVRSALGGLDIIVNNAAGFGPARLLGESSWEAIDDEWQAVVKPVFTVTRAALPVLQAQGHGRIVNLSATMLQRPAIRYGAHAMAKAAVLAFTRTLAREVGPDGITVNAVSPGMTMTAYSRSLPEAEQAAVRERTPLRRLAEPEDVANAVLFFCSPLADFITGSNIAPDGGLAIL